MELQKLNRNNFPECTRNAVGMQVIRPEITCCELQYIEDLVYIKRGNQELHLQLLLPSDDAGTLHPLILYIPGSAFYRQQVKPCIPRLSLLASRGYAVALLEYRGSEDAIFPSVVLDAKAGIVFLKEHAAEYHLNPEQFVLMGDSSGGYTALMAGLTYQEKLLEDEISAGIDYRVKAIVDYYGPTDFTTMNDEPSLQDHRVPDSPEGCFIGRKEVDPESELVQQTIIKNHISPEKNYPPVLMFHGSADELVPFSRSCELYEVLKQQGHDVTLYQVKGAHHGGAEFWSEQVLGIVEAFIMC